MATKRKNNGLIIWLRRFGGFPCSTLEGWDASGAWGWTGTEDVLHSGAGGTLGYRGEGRQ